MLNIDSMPYELEPKVPSFREILLKSMDEQNADTEPALDNLTEFLLNFNCS